MIPFQIKRLDAGDLAAPRTDWVESTAPLNVEDKTQNAGAVCSPPPADLRLKEIGDPDQAIADIADYLNHLESPDLVVTVHGFNNPLCVVLHRFE